MARKTRPRRRWIAALAGGCLLLVLVAAYVGVWARSDSPRQSSAAARATYVGRSICAECHAKENRLWTGSDHDKAMQLATPETVLGNFNDREFTYQGVTSRMSTKDGRYYVRTEGPDGKYQDFLVKYTFGVRPLQQYMVQFPDGRVQVLRIAWDTDQKKWFYVPPPDVIDERIEPGDPLHWTGVAQNWNHTCAECHSTDYQKNYDLATNTYHSTFTEIDVSCESCHGPGSRHVELARSGALGDEPQLGTGLTVRLKTTAPSSPFVPRPLASTKAQLETCAACHSRRVMVQPGFQPGDELLDHFEPALLDEGLYHADGQILDEVYVYGSFLQSEMYHKGVTCTDCHDPHSLELRYQGNRLCTQCHQAARYDTPVHHHHAADSAGASCVACHMPAKKYMVVDARRDHSMHVPRPDLTVALGTPNACNHCHQKPDETPAWAADTIRKWYGPERAGWQKFASALAAARRGQPEGERQLLNLLDQPRPAAPDTPAIVRATALSLLGQYNSQQSAAACVAALADPDPLVRLAAVRQLSIPNPRDLVERIAPLLSDPVQSVRMAAARRLAQLPSQLIPTNRRTAYEKALREYIASQSYNNDRMTAHMNLGNLYLDLGYRDRAVDSFRTALRVEPYFTGPRSQLANLLDGQPGHQEEARRLRAEELELLRRDARFLPDNALLRYRLGLAAYLAGRLDEAEAALVAACRLDPRSYESRLALVLLYEKQGKWQQALASLDTLAQLRPGDPSVDALRQQIRGEAAAAGHSDQ